MCKGEEFCLVKRSWKSALFTQKGDLLSYVDSSRAVAGDGRGDEDIGNVRGPMLWPSAHHPAPTSGWQPEGQEVAAGSECG